MIRRKYPNQNISIVDLTLIEGYNVLNSNNGSKEVEERGSKANADQDSSEGGDDPLTFKAQMSLEH